MSKKHGKGKYTWADGSIYSGQWVENKINGVGVYLWKDGRRYYGQWKDNDMEGIGIYFYSDGMRYDGQYLKDKKEGYGMYQWIDGRRFEGWWHNGKQHGLGIYFDKKQENVKYGLWEAGKRVKWFDEQTVLLINQKRYDFQVAFNEDKSAKVLPTGITFNPPRGFKQQLNEIQTKLEVPQPKVSFEQREI
jgi:hypothetical protein